MDSRNPWVARSRDSLPKDFFVGSLGEALDESVEELGSSHECVGGDELVGRMRLVD